MMEMGCSLGPIEVWVETIDRAPSPDGFDTGGRMAMSTCT